MADLLKYFLRGFAKLLDITGSLRDPEVDEILERSDADALRSDWGAVGGNMWAAIEEFERKGYGKYERPTKPRHQDE